MSDNFYDNQSNLTAAKIKIFESYIGQYLITLLMKFGRCLIADLFCGPGKNGNKNGSPMTLIKQASLMLESPILKRKHPNANIIIVFNDKEPSHIASLNATLNSADLSEKINILPPQSKTFCEILKDYEYLLKYKIPKFFFLDPFGYSDIQLHEISKIMSFPFSEVLLFLPIIDIYRFAGSKASSEQLNRFLENFTTRGNEKYKSIYELIQSIKDKLSIDLSIDFVRPILMADGCRTNALIYLTKSLKGMITMNDIIWRLTDNGQIISASELNKSECSQMQLIDISDIETFSLHGAMTQLHLKLENELKNKRTVKNTDVIKFVAMQGFRLMHARKILENLMKDKKINVKYLTAKNRGFYISDDNRNNELCLIKYLV